MLARVKYKLIIRDVLNDRSKRETIEIFRASTNKYAISFERIYWFMIVATFTSLNNEMFEEKENERAFKYTRVTASVSCSVRARSLAPFERTAPNRPTCEANYGFISFFGSSRPITSMSTTEQQTFELSYLLYRRVTKIICEFPP